MLSVPNDSSNKFREPTLGTNRVSVESRIEKNHRFNILDSMNYEDSTKLMSMQIYPIWLIQFFGNVLTQSLHMMEILLREREGFVH